MSPDFGSYGKEDFVAGQISFYCLFVHGQGHNFNNNTQWNIGVGLYEMSLQIRMRKALLRMPLS